MALTPLVDAREGQPAHPTGSRRCSARALRPASSPNRTLEQGDHGAAVRTLQRALRAWGFTIVVDGDFGAQTVSVLKEYQRVHQLRQSGRTDRDTRYFLDGADYY